MNAEQTQQYIISAFKTIFGVETADANTNFFMLGGTSLNAVKLSAMLYHDTGIRLDVQHIFEAPTIQELTALISKLDHTADNEIKIISDKKHMYEPFVLTDVQHAYWMGKHAGTELGGIITHCYIELESEYTNIIQWNEALQFLIRKHPMLRCRILENGMQQFDKETESVQIDSILCKNIQEFCTVSEEIRHSMEDGRAFLSDSKHFALKLCIFEDKTRVHLLFDSVIFDGRSIFLFLHDLKQHLSGAIKKLPVSTPEITFRDYACTLLQIKETEQYQQDKMYYLSRLEDFRKIPEFYGLKSSIKSVHQISHHRWIADKKDWKQFRRICSENDITPNAALMELYAEMIALWSGSFAFTLNFTAFSREDSLSDIIGDFTKLLLIPVSLTNGFSFVERTKTIMHSISDAVKHQSFGTLEIERTIAKTYGMKSYSFPIVFTGMIGTDAGLELPGNISYLSTETSQVWLDMQVMELNDTLEVHFDTAEDLFPHAFTETMLQAFIKAFCKLVENKEIANLQGSLSVSAGTYPIRESYNSITAPIPDETLDSLFVAQAEKTPDNFAVLSENSCLTYQELFNMAMSFAEKLYLSKDKYIIIMLPKGIFQPSAVMGILMAGKAYVAVDPSNPTDRKKKILLSVNGSTIITLSSFYKEAEEMGAETIIFADKLTVSHHDFKEYHRIDSSHDSAYIIFTSGSTGMPKGVEITHRGVLNTILDVNARFHIGATDRTLALSNLNFDLSVYDIFGMLCCGGAVVELNHDENRNPEKWLTLMRNFNVSVWNSVPAFMQMLLEYTDSDEISAFRKLRRVLLSGDKIPVTLPEQIRLHNADIQVICLGGATEASIWSNYYIAEKTDFSWNMMPYGYPLCNQKYYILNQLMMDCPDNVKGRLYIGGEGLAVGYLGDSEKTAQKFVYHPLTGERIYDTGDNGRYWSDGTIEFIGRDDYQVKINGHRIELGEVEAVCSAMEHISDCCAVVLKNGQLRNKIAVMLKTDSIDAENFHKFIRKKLPDYMLPAFFVAAQEFPVTGNGKTDRNAIQSKLEQYAEEIQATTSQNPVVLDRYEQKIASLWCKLLEKKSYNSEDDFFECGGDSLLMITFLNQLNKQEHIKITPDMFYAGSTIGELAEILKNMNPGSDKL